MSNKPNYNRSTPKGEPYLRSTFLTRDHLSSPQHDVYWQMWNTVDYYSKRTGVYTPSSAHLAKQTRLSDKTVQRALLVLIDKGYIEVASARHGCATAYHVNNIDWQTGLPVATHHATTKRLESFVSGGDASDDASDVGDAVDEVTQPRPTNLSTSNNLDKTSSTSEATQPSLDQATFDDDEFDPYR